MLDKKTVYGICDVTFYWSCHETVAGSEYCTLEKVEAGHYNMVEIPIGDDERAYWAKQCESVSGGLTHYWTADEAEAYDRISLECYLDAEEVA